MKITNPGSEIARMSYTRYRTLSEDFVKSIENIIKTRASIVDEYFPTAITDEVMTNPVYKNPKKFYSGEIPMLKIRFGDLKKDDVFWFAGKQMKKLEDNSLHAITITDRGKESFMFFKHNLVNVESVVENNDVNELDCFYAHNIPFGKTSFIHCFSSEEPGTTFISDSDPDISNDLEKVCTEEFIHNTRLETETINYFGTEIIQHNIYKTDLGTISYDCNTPYESCFPDSIESLLKPRNSLSKKETIFLDVQPVSEDYIQTLLKPYTVKTNSTLSDHDRNSLAMID